ncbi:FAST kinase domain-containing protein 5, mitochondrial-like [Argonauta hians]
MLLKTVCQTNSKRFLLSWIPFQNRPTSTFPVDFELFLRQLRRPIAFHISLFHQYLPFCQNHNNLVSRKRQDTFCSLSKNYSFVSEDKRDSVFQRHETENEHFYNYLSHNSEYSSFFLSPIYTKHCDKKRPATDLSDFLQDFPAYTPSQILDKFNDLSKCLPEQRRHLFRDEQFHQICTLLMRDLPSWNTKQLFECMNIIINWEFRSSNTKQQRNIGTKFAKRFDEECLLRVKDFTLKQIFQANNFFFLLYFYRNCKFKHRFFESIKDKMLNKEEIVLSLFYASLARQIPLEIIIQIILRLPSIVENLAIEEIAIICLGFFKTRSQIRNSHFLEVSTEKLRKNLYQADSFTVTSIFKGLQISCSKSVDKTMLPLFEKLDQLIDPISKQLSKYTFSSFMHIFLFFHNIHFISDNFVINVKERLNFEEFSSYRLKDISKICYSVANLEPVLEPMPEFWNKILLVLESNRIKSEIMNFPQCLLNILVSMSFIDHYPLDWIDFTFQPQMLEQIHSLRKTQRLDLRRELFHLSESVKLERPDYSGHRLPDDFLHTLSKNHEVFCELPDLKSPELSHRDSLLLKLLTSFDSLFHGDADNYQIICFLPHFQIADIEVHIGQNGKLVPVEEWILYRMPPLKESKEYSRDSTCLNKLLLQMVTSNSSVQRAALVVLGPNAFCRFHSNTGVSYVLTGLHKARIRQLKLKGFKVIEIPFFEIHGDKKKLYDKLTAAFSKSTA